MIVTEVSELHKPMLCRVVHQDCLKKMLLGWPFICTPYHDIWETLGLLKCGCLCQYHGPISMSSDYNRMAIR